MNLFSFQIRGVDATTAGEGRAATGGEGVRERLQRPAGAGALSVQSTQKSTFVMVFDSSKPFLPAVRV